MADNRKYYYMRLMENYFEMNEQLYLESLPDGYLYSNILLKLYLRSLERDGLLMFNDRTPYNPQMIAHMTRHPVEVVERALRLFEELGIIEVQENGAMYMLDMQSFVGKTSTETERKREYRQRIREAADQDDPAAWDTDGTDHGTTAGTTTGTAGGTQHGTNRGTNDGTMSRTMSRECPPEIETETELQQETEREQGYGRVTGISLSVPAREESCAAACPVEAEASGTAASARPGGCWVSATVAAADPSARPEANRGSDGSASGGVRAGASDTPSARPEANRGSDRSASGGVRVGASDIPSARPEANCGADGSASGGVRVSAADIPSARPAANHGADGSASGGAVSGSGDAAAREPVSGSEYVPARELNREERELVNAWNTLGIQRLTYNMPPEVRRAFDVLVSQHSIPEIRAVIEKMRDCYYLLGVNRTGWTATISWLANLGNFLNVKAGVYTYRGNAA